MYQILSAIIALFGAIVKFILRLGIPALIILSVSFVLRRAGRKY